MSKSIKLLFVSSFCHMARYAPSTTYKNTLLIEHKSTHQKY